MNPSKDPELLTTLHVRRAKDGDTQSTAWLIERFTPLLLAQARLRLRGRKSALGEPEDLVQDVWSIALPRLPDLNERDGRQTPVLVKFLASTLLYRVNGMMRRGIRERLESPDPTSSSSSGGTPLDREPGRGPGVVSQAAGREAQRLLAQSLDQLEERDREVVVLRGIERLSNAAVAALCQETPNAISLRYNRALAKLEKLLPNTIFGELEEPPSTSRNEAEGSSVGEGGHSQDLPSGPKEDAGDGD